VKGAIDMGDLVEVRAFRQRRWPTGLVPFWRGGGRLYGIRKGRTARMVRRCLRRHGKAWEDPNEGLYGGPPQVGS
jgi:hypothetical protein